ncbi:DUF4236 domain-containing protein [Pseudovibrio ascidiaceicola]|uniref:DUF4236 domain-containing protein n=1 Tax=Pseudovibrio ascidiaceicola TaxID=285279 RepID=UPI003D36706C
MSFRFRKRVKVAPGLHLNFSKSGITTSIGGKGASVNLSSKGIRSTVGIPGTGLSWSQQLKAPDNNLAITQDKLSTIAHLLPDLENDISSIYSQAEKLTKSWNSSIDRFEGGRGPTDSKFQTLIRKCETTISSYEDLEFKAEDISEALQIIERQLGLIRIGIFGSKRRRLKEDITSIVSELNIQLQQYHEALITVKTEIGEELDEAEIRLHKDGTMQDI